MIDFDEIRKEVAIKHGFVLDENDPVLVSVTLNRLMLRDYIKEISAYIDAHDEKHLKKLSDALDVTVQKSQRIGENIAKTGADQCRKAIEESLKEVEERVNKKVVFIMKTREEAVTAKELSFYAAGMSLFFMFVTWAIVIGKWIV